MESSEPNARNADLSGLRIDRGSNKAVPGRRKKWLHLLWIFAPGILWFGYNATVKQVTPASKVQVGTVRILTGNDAAAELVATGYVVAQVKAAVSSKATGRLEALNVEEGDVVKKGAVIAELENDDIMADLDLQRANLKIALADSVKAYLNWQRQKKLLESGHTTEEVYEAAVAEYQRAVGQVEASAASIRAEEVALDNTIVRAPFDGTVLTKHADVGEMVAPFASASSSKGAVVTLADMSSLEVEADVSEANIQKVRVGAPCEIILDAYPALKYKGHVKKIVPTADRARATVMTKIAFSNIDSKVLPEMSARVNFMPSDSGSEEAVEQILVVPNKALTSRDERQVVFVIKDNQTDLRNVTIGRRLNDVTEVISGLQAGEQVVLSPPGGMESGQKIEISK